MISLSYAPALTRHCRDGITTTRVIGFRKWVRDAEDPYAMRAVMSDGSRTAKIDFRPMLADFLHEIDLQGRVSDAVTEAMRTASLKPCAKRAQRLKLHLSMQ